MAKFPDTQFILYFGQTALNRNNWNPTPLTSWSKCAKRFVQHETGEKDGPCFVQGELVEGNRKDKAVDCNHIIGFDVDNGTPIEEVIDNINATGFAAAIYTTYSHLKNITNINRDGYFRWAKTKDVTLELVKEHLLEVKSYRSEIVDTVEIASKLLKLKDGAVIQVRHDPMTKLRVILPLSEPFPFILEDESQNERINEWKNKYGGLGELLNIPYDRSCTNPSRLFYLPRCPEGAEVDWEIIEGNPVNLSEVPDASVVHGRRTRRKSAGDAFIDAGEADNNDDRDRYIVGDMNLKLFAVEKDKTFEIQDALEDCAGDDILRSPRSSGPGIHIECPFEDYHTESGGTGCYVINGTENDDDGGFVIHCLHDSCADHDRLDFLKKMVDNGWLTEEDLLSDDYHAEIEQEDAPAAENAESDFALFNKRIRDLNAGDRDSTNNLINDIAGVSTLTQIDIEQLSKAISLASGYGKTAVTGQIKDLRKRITIENHTAGDQIPSVALDADLRKALKRANKDWAMVDIGGKKSFIKNPDKINFGIVNYQAFTLTMANKRVPIMTERGIKIANVGEEWIKWEDRREYDRLVFEPSGCKENEFNTWKDWPFIEWAEKKPTASWDLMHEHIKENICEGNKEYYKYFMDWVAHMFQFPGKKVGVALVIRGKRGTGKSIFFKHVKKCMDRYAIIASNKKHITGNFNEKNRTLILLICEEALWAGDQEGGGILKELITGDTQIIEPKGVDSEEAANHLRLAFLSNEDWVVPASLIDERRYFVLNIGEGRIKDIEFFTSVRKQMKNGGLEAMFHFFMNRELTKEDIKMLWDAPITDALIEQAIESLPAHEAFVIDAIMDGAFGFGDDYDEIELSTTEPTAVSVKALFKLFEKKMNRVGGSARHHAKNKYLEGSMHKYITNEKYSTSKGFSKSTRSWKVPPLCEVKERLHKEYGITLTTSSNQINDDSP